MDLGYPNGCTRKEIPFAAQIIRVADEYDAIVSKRQYKSHIDISDTLDILISHTKPTPDNPASKLKNCGKVEPKIVKALLKIVKVDIEYEISCLFDYVEHLKSQVNRLENIKKWHTEMEKTNKPKQKESYMQMIKKSFDQGENMDNYEQILEEYKNAFQIREEKIQLLYREIKKIKKMKVR